MANTLAVGRRLEVAGVDRAMTEAHADAIQTAVDDRKEHLSTKADLAVLKTDIAAMEAHLTWRMVGLLIGGGLIIAILKFLP